MKKFRLRLTQELEMVVIIEADDKGEAWERYTLGEYEFESRTEERDDSWDCPFDFMEEIEEIK